MALMGGFTRIGNNEITVLLNDAEIFCGEGWVMNLNSIWWIGCVLHYNTRV